MLVDVPFLGMRGTGDWVTNQRPENWREMILYLYPNGDAPLTAIMSMMDSESTDDPHYHWWTEILASQRADLTGTFTDAALTVAYVSGGVKDDVIYARMAAAEVDRIRVGHEVMFLCSVDPTMRVVGKVTARSKNGASSYVAVTLLEADDNSTNSRDISDSDVVWIVGNINPEGGTLPDVIMYDPTEYENYTQIFRTPLSHTRTAKRTRLRTGDQVAKAKKQALELHGVEMEKAYIFGVPTVNTGSNGKPERTTRGILNFINTHIYDFPSDGGTWLYDGDDWLDDKLEAVFRFGSQEKLGFCGGGVMRALMKIAKAKGTFELTEMKTAYGVKIFEWVTGFGTLYFKVHPMFNYEPTMRHNMIIMDTKNLRNRYIDDTKYLPNRQANDIDGEASEYLTESGLELHHEETFAYLTGLGKDSWGDLTTAAPTTAAPTTVAATTAAPTTAAPTTL